jgi:serine protease Do
VKKFLFGSLWMRWKSCHCALFVMLLGSASTLAGAASAQSASADHTADALRQMSGSFESLARHVSPAVVEVMVTGFGSADDEDSESQNSAPSPLGRERSLGSGVIIDANGYIVTNYHVVRGAERVRVLLTPAATGESGPTALLKSRGRVLPAEIVGFSKLIDLAVLKINATGLPTLPLGKYEQVHKGQIVLAFGSPEGLENSVTLGLISSVLRQPDPDDPMVYIQTDAAINPGNSGGPLVDVDGNVVGINTFIYTNSGGNEGIGFAIPSGIVRYAYEQIRQFGRVRRRSIGAELQTLTPDMAQALGIQADAGVIVSDVFPGGSAEHAGLRVQDVIVALDGLPVDNVPLFVLGLYLLSNGETTHLQVLRGDKKMELALPVFEPKNDPSRLSELGDPRKDLIQHLGIVGVTVTPEIADIFGDLRDNTGVLVTARVANRLAVDSGLQEGDVIHALNRTRIKNVDELRTAFNKVQPGDPVALQVERNGKFTYLTFEME